MAQHVDSHFRVELAQRAVHALIYDLVDGQQMDVVGPVTAHLGRGARVAGRLLPLRCDLPKDDGRVLTSGSFGDAVHHLHVSLYDRFGDIYVLALRTPGQISRAVLKHVVLNDAIGTVPVVRTVVTLHCWSLAETAP